MESFFKDIIEGSKIVPPIEVANALLLNFPDSINIEWSKRNENFEAIFYKDQIEHIALFDKEGLLIEYKISLADSYLPEQIKNDLEQRGEIMNTVLINRGNQLFYEVIFRDQPLERFVILVDALGQVISEKKL